MIRLTLALLLFLGVALSEIAHAREGGSAPPAAPPVEASRVPEAAKSPKEPTDARRAIRPRTPRWTPRQQRRNEEIGPRMTVYPALVTPSGIPQLPF
jgi:hypothetical protein